MSEEAVRQTRSQKRALEREAPPPSSEAPPTEPDSKKHKLEDPETRGQEEEASPSLPRPDFVPSQDGPSRTSMEAQPDLDSEPAKLTLPQPLTLPALPVKDERDHNHKLGSESRAEGVWTERGGRARGEAGLEGRTRIRPEGKGAGGLLAGGEVKGAGGLLAGGEVKGAGGLLAGGEVKGAGGLLAGGEVKGAGGLLAGGEVKGAGGLLAGGEVKGAGGLLAGGEVKGAGGLLAGGEVKGAGGLLAGGEVKGAGGLLAGGEVKGAGGLLAGGEVKATIKVEVQTGEQPVDMSTSRSFIKREKRPPSVDDDDDDDDVIILSDHESPSPAMNGLSHLKELDTELLMKSSPEERDLIIQQLKQELRLEEAKLVLLKKLRQSQTQKKPSGLSTSAAPPPLIRGTITANKGSQQVVTGRSAGTVIPPPLVRGGQQVSSKHSSQVLMPPLVRGAQVSQGPRPTPYVQPISVSPQQIQALRQQQQQQLAASGGSGSGSGPPPLLLAPRTSATGAQAQRGLVQSGLIRVGNVSNTSLLVNISQASATNLKGSSLVSQAGGAGGVSVVSESPASRQAAAKLALRKQLEKTLLEIPPPKPPAPELSFHPSAANNEFIYLVGLEDVVQNLLDTFSRAKNPGVPFTRPASREPYTCSQCSTDFTCRWRQDKAKGGTILCEDCMTSNQKKALKAEHTNRLKAAFVKALQQEQEIEQRLLQQASSSPASHPPSSSSSSSSSPSSLKVEQLVSQQLKQAQARASSLQQQQQHSRGQHSIARHHTSSIKQSPQGQLSRGSVSSSGAVRGVPHSFSSSSQLQSAVAAAALVNRPGKHAAHAPRPSGHSSKVAGTAGTGGSLRGAGGGSASASAWRKQNNSTGVTMAYVNPSLSGHKTSSAVDARQREYLLDMIPSRSISQTANTWK